MLKFILSAGLQSRAVSISRLRREIHNPCAAVLSGGPVY